MAQSMLAGGVVLGAVPVGLAAIFVTAGNDDRGPRAAELFAEAGPWAYAVLLAALLASGFAALMVGLSGKRLAFLPGAVIAFAFPLMVALLGGELGLGELTEAVTHASPADQATIIAGSAGERIGLVQLTLLIVGSGWLLVTIGVLLSLGAGQVPARLGLSGASAVLTLSAFTLAFHVMQISGTFRAVVMVSPAERGRILGAGLLETEPTYRVGMGLLLVAVLVTLMVGALSLRLSAPMGVATVVCCLSGALSLGALEARTRHSLLFVPVGVGARATDLFEVTGKYSEGDVVWLDPGESPESIDEKVKEGGVFWRNKELNVTSLFASKTLTHAQVVRFLQGAQMDERAVNLVGQGRARPVVAPDYARRFLELLDVSMEAVRVEPRLAGEPCERCVGTAKALRGKLEVTLTDKPVESWELAEGRSGGDDALPPLLDFEWAGEVDELVSAASVAFTHGHCLSIAVPARE